jgi:hypothetical protein
MVALGSCNLRTCGTSVRLDTSFPDLTFMTFEQLGTSAVVLLKVNDSLLRFVCWPVWEAARPFRYA